VRVNYSLCFSSWGVTVISIVIMKQITKMHFCIYKLAVVTITLI